MRIVTVQGYDLQAFHGPIELERGKYNGNANISQAQRKIYDLIDEDQVVWCGQNEPSLVDERERYVHDIDVDPRDIVAVVDTLVWCHIIKYDSRYILPEEHSDLRFQAGISGEDDRDAVLGKLEDEYLAALPDDLWSGVIKPKVSKKSDQLLVRFPFAFSTIVNVDLVTDDMVQRGCRIRKRQTTNR